jgi:hypothetical protein
LVRTCDGSATATSLMAARQVAGSARNISGGPR